ncbi:hypothetical protein [Legionella tunisiensis]|uniref:hypothetical protein n=1 Tax=Legionella tunisiensis TaxID=1034944 RepID=UPI0002DBFF9C|nr:hypothetical protein [Legionella tunisiensis]
MTEHENFKKWLKHKCSPQTDTINTFEYGVIHALYNPKREVFIMLPSQKEYSREIVENAFQHEVELNHLIIEMLEQ